MKRLLRRLALYVFIVLFGSGCLWVTWNILDPWESGQPLSPIDYGSYWKIVPLVAVVIGVAFLRRLWQGIQGAY